MRTVFPILTLSLALLAASACTVHRLDLRQGNYLTAELVEQLETGMTREQVRFLLGSPLAASSFHPERWDFVYYLDSRYRENQRTYLVVWFDGDVVERIETRDLPER